ncbi:protein obstructor-E-like [Artemia franciscana]|uniref:Chitin-binding type-2 domain-containing protein n=1 Tax=Artemia franciscana TaxID=6661 RepID=A0AA88HD01_ARTSF|nr:hypothetical protein QYM36_013428 [Artemia franciscana]
MLGLFAFSIMVFAVVAVPAKSGGVVCEKSKFPYFVADSTQCDRFYKCEDLKSTEMLCEDGMVFVEELQKCDLPFHVDCTSRPNLQPPKGFGNCSRLNGLFPVNSRCDQHFWCRDGQEILIECAPGLVYDVKQGVCEFPDIALRPGCLPEQFLGFTCPKITGEKMLKFGDHERLAKPSDCRYFYKCMSNGLPRLGGCELGKVFNHETGFCDLPKNVKGCEHYYDKGSS